jgi:phosphatidylglycerol lysyltransferase
MRVVRRRTQTGEPETGGLVRWAHRLIPVLATGLFLLALWILHRDLAAYHWKDIRHSFLALRYGQILLSVLLTVVSYALLTGHDFLAVRYVGRVLPWYQVALGSYLGYVLSHNIGALLGATVPRYRVYTAAGLSPTEVARLFAFTSTGFWVGWVLMTGVVLIVHPGAAPLPLGPVALRVIGAAFVVVVGSYVGLAAVHREPLKLGRLRIAVPPLRLAGLQVAISVIDWLACSAALWVLLPGSATLSFTGFLCVFLIAVMAGVLSHVPGGLGVFDSILLIGLSGKVPGPAVIGALVAFRIVYYLGPLVLAGCLFAVFESLERRHWFTVPLVVFNRWVSFMVPPFFAATTFVGGALLLFSGATSRGPGQFSVVRELLPLPVIELSHFLASLVGLGLILLAAALQRRLDAAYHLTVALLACGVVVSLLRGFNYHEALLLAVMLVALIPCQRHFYRHSAVLREPLTLGWSLAVAATLGAWMWVGLFVYRHVEYSNQLWWQFTLNGHAPRFLRASLGAVVGTLLFAGARLLRPARPPVLRLSADDAQRVRAIVAASPRCSARLALLGDKSFLFSDANTGFVMYAVSGRSWVSMGDPVEPAGEQGDLVWRFCEACDRYAAWPVFYEVGADQLPVYLDVGLLPLKIGEEARVPLETFTLEGSSRREARGVLRRGEREGATFEIVPPEGVAQLIPELRFVSDAWLNEKKTREKGFSIGCFRPEYLENFPIALVRRGGVVVAFANLWCGADKEEFSPDLMRYGPDAPYAAMDYLFLQLMLWGKTQGYRWFYLGGAPFSGLADHPLSPLWHRVGTFLFQHGEHFYNFQGLRAYKEKFDPVWKPIYLVSPGGIALPRILSNVAALISGSLSGVVKR